MITLDDICGKKTNLHTHTVRCMHAEGEDREYVEAAIEAGYEVLGFSDHSPYYFLNGYESKNKMKMSELPGYVDSILSLKEEYKKDITIYLGLEMEYYPDTFSETLSEIKKYPMDYLILGQHGYNDELSVDGYPGCPTDKESSLELYVKRIIEGLSTNEFLYAAHPDLINYTGPVDIYYKHMKALAIYLKEHNYPMEVNINGLRRNVHYTSDKFMDICKETGLNYIIGVDAHRPKELLDFRTYHQAVIMTGNRDGKFITDLIDFNR